MRVPHIDRRAAIAGVSLLLVAGAGAIANPRQHLADQLPPLDFEANIPSKFGNWITDRAMVPVLPAADVQKRLDKLYNLVFSRTYVDTLGRHIMLLIAYGADQADRTTLAHLPPSCYSSQGFEVSPTTLASVAVSERSVDILRIRTRRGTRVEPVTYWTTVGNRAFTEEVGRRWARARYALHGIIPDGMLVRVSSIDTHEAEGFELQSVFIAQLYASLPPPTRARVFGSPS